MSQTIEVETPQGVQTLEFPDEASEDTIRSAIKRDFGEKEQSSAVGAFSRAAAPQIAPSLAAAASIGPGAALGEAVWPAGGGIVGGIAAPLVVGGLAAAGQEKLLQKVAPKFYQKLVEKQQQDAAQQKVATLGGEFAGSMAGFRPTLSGVRGIAAIPKILRGTASAAEKAGLAQAGIGTAAQLGINTGEELIRNKRLPTGSEALEDVAQGVFLGQPRIQGLAKTLPLTVKAAAKAIGEKNAREISQTAEVHGNVRPQQTPTGELPKPEGERGVQPQAERGIQEEARPQQTGELGLTDEEADYLEKERQGLGAPVQIVPHTGGDNEPFAASQIARPNRKTGEIEVNAPAYKQWLSEMQPEQRQQAVRSLLAEERIHLGVNDQQAGDYWNNLTALEKAAERKAYTNDWRGLHPDTGERISDTLMGHEAVRRRLQQLARMPTTEVAALVGRERLSLQAIEALSRTVRAIREGLGTKASREQLAIIDHIQGNLDAAKAAAAQQPAALRRPRKGEERNQPTFDLPGVVGKPQIDQDAIAKLQRQLGLSPEAAKELLRFNDNYEDFSLRTFLRNEMAKKGIKGRLGNAPPESGGHEEAYGEALNAAESSGGDILAERAGKLRDIEEQRPSAEQAGAPSRHAAEGLIEPEDLYFREKPSEDEGLIDITERKQRENRLKSQAYIEVLPEHRDNVKRLNGILTTDARVSGGKAEDTRRVTALVNKRTHEVALVSTFPRPIRTESVPKAERAYLRSIGQKAQWEAWLRNPNPTMEGNKRLADLMGEWTPIDSYLLQDKRKGFIKTFPDLEAYDQQFREPAKSVLGARITAPEGGGAFGWEFDEEGNPKRVPMAPTPPGMAYYEQPLTHEEALAPVEHIEGEAGGLKSPEDVIASMDAVTRDVRQGTGTSASAARKVYAQLVTEIDRKNPELATEQKLNKLAQFIYDNHRTAPDAETFIRRTIEATGRPYLESPASTQPQAQGQARELTMPRFARKGVPAEPFTAQPRPAGEAQPTTFGMEHPTYQATGSEGQTPIPTAREALQARSRYEYQQRQKARGLEAARMEQDPFARMDKLAQQEPAALNARVKQWKEEGRDQWEIIKGQVRTFASRRETRQEIPRIVDGAERTADIYANSGKANILLDSESDLPKNATWKQRRAIKAEAAKRRAAYLPDMVTRREDPANPGVEIRDQSQLGYYEGLLNVARPKAEYWSKSTNPIKRIYGKKWLANIEKYQQGLDYAKAHWNDPDFVRGADTFSREMRAEFERENKGGLDVNWRDGYYPGYYDGAFLNGNSILFGKRILLGEKFSSPKRYATPYEAIADGPYWLVSHDAADIAAHRIKRGQMALSRTLASNQLKAIRDAATGDPLAMEPERRMTPADVTGPIVRTTGAVSPYEATVRTQVPGVSQHVPKGRPDYVLVELGDTGQKLAVKRGFEDVVRACFGTSPLDTFEIHGFPVGRTAKVANQSIKHGVWLLLDTFHPGRIGQYAMALSSKSGFRSGASALTYRPENMQRAVDQGHIRQQDMDWALTKVPVNVGEGKTEQWTRQRVLQELGVRSGLNSTKMVDALYKDAIQSVPAFGPLWHKIFAPYNRLLFENFIPGLMSEGFVRNFEDMQAKHPEIPAATISRDLIGDFNAFYGNLGRQGVFRNPMFRDIASLAFLAPGWSEGLITKEVKFASRASGLSYLMGRRAPSQLGALGSAMAKGLATYFIATQLINLATRRKFTWDNEEEGHKMDAFIPTDNQGGGAWLSPMSVFAEEAHQFVRLNETLPTVWDAVVRMGENKLGPMGKMMLTAVTGKAGTGEKFTTTGGVVKGAASELLGAPIALTPLAQLAGHAALPNQISPPAPGRVMRQSIAGLAGLKVETSKSPLQQIAAKARDFAVKEGYSKETGWQEIMTDQPSYSKLRLALRNDDQKEAVRQWRELRKAHSEDQIVHAMKLWAKKPLTGSAKGERAFIYSLDNRDLERYWQANQQRQTELERFYDFYTRQ